MKRIRTSIATLLLAAIAGHGEGTAEAGEVAWRLARERDGIVVHTRPVEGSGIREFRGSALIAAPPDAVHARLRDADRFVDWFPNTSESRLLSRRGEIAYQYSVLDAPWPVSDRDNVLRSESSIEPATGRVRILVVAAPDDYPEQPGRVRVRRARGEWLLEPVGPGQTRVTFTMHLEPGGGVPAWLIDARIVETPFEALANLRRALAGL